MVVRRRATCVRTTIPQFAVAEKYPNTQNRGRLTQTAWGGAVGGARRLHVALAVPQGLTFLERVLQGVADYARQAGGWTFTRVPEALGTSARWLRHWQGDGAFALLVTRADAGVARRLPFPVVNLAS